MRSERAVTVYRKLVRDRIPEGQAADEKRAARGGFAGRIWLEETVG